MDSFLETRGILHTDVIENLVKPKTVRGMLKKLPDVPEVTCAASSPRPDTRVEELTLEGGWLTLGLVMEALTESSGQGRCRLIMCYEDTAARYRDQLEAWASTRGWGVTQDNEYFVKIERS